MKRQNSKSEPISGEFLQHFASGIRMLEAGFKNRMRHGPFRLYYESGELMIEGTFDHDRRVDKTTAWYKSGKKMAELVGDTLIRWNESGEIIQSCPLSQKGEN